MSLALMLHRTYLLHSCSLGDYVIPFQNMEASAMCTVGRDHARPPSYLSPEFTVFSPSKSILWGQLPTLYMFQVLQGSEVLRWPQVTQKLGQDCSLWGKPLLLQLSHYYRWLCNPRFQITVAQGETGIGNEHQRFIQCSLLKPLTVAEQLVNITWAQSPL